LINIVVFQVTSTRSPTGGYYLLEERAASVFRLVFADTVRIWVVYSSEMLVST